MVQETPALGPARQGLNIILAFVIGPQANHLTLLNFAFSGKIKTIESTNMSCFLRL